MEDIVRFLQKVPVVIEFFYILEEFPNPHLHILRDAPQFSHRENLTVLDLSFVFQDFEEDLGLFGDAQIGDIRPVWKRRLGSFAFAPSDGLKKHLGVQIFYLLHV